MNPETITKLCVLNNAFYRDNSVSFSETRQSPWPGWTRCLEVLRYARTDGRLGGWADDYSDDQRAFSVFDLACGNLRFENFLASALPETTFTVHAVDNCDCLVPPMSNTNYQSLDILNTLQNGLCLNDQLTAPLCDLAVSFGFLHHIPLREYREEVLASLLRQTRPGGFVIVSLWQFLNDETLAKQAQITHERAIKELDLPTLDDNDYLLGWKNLPNTYRYCHSFSEIEIDRLIESVVSKPLRTDSASASVSTVARFASDGRTANLNTYLILKVF
ncbi:MAG: class I SAM-dependent methyltransferase [Coriobacteriales bacterium]|jgi:SAM-dependent methyltransferase|nr:class I SAM-dependent methyltransferase [Coriobacteriales bacterium]